MPLADEQQDMQDFSHDDTSVRQLVGRVSPVHLQQRLGIEQDHEASIFGQGLNCAPRKLVFPPDADADGLAALRPVPTRQTQCPQAHRPAP